MSRLLSALCVWLTGWLALPALAEPPIKVVASFSILGDMARQVGGDAVQVVTLVGPNSDAHAYQPTPADARELAAARLVVVNGLGFEGWLDRLVRASGYKGPVLSASKGVKPLALESEAHGHEKGTAKTDPHAWQSLANGQIYVRNILDGLVTVDPANATAYRARGEAYLRELGALEAQVQVELGEIPQPKRRLITSHDAFQYFARAYDVQILAAVGVSTESQASAKQVAQLIRQIRRQGVKALFIENMTDPRLIEQIARESGGVMGGTLYADALSRPDDAGGTYARMFRHNVAVLKAGMLQN